MAIRLFFHPRLARRRLSGRATARRHHHAEPVTVTGKADPVTIGGGATRRLSRSPFQASIVSSEQMRDLGVQRLSDIGASTRRQRRLRHRGLLGLPDGARLRHRQPLQLPPRRLPINAETSIPLDNKERIEILKGTSGLQAGTSAPGRPGELRRQAADRGADPRGHVELAPIGLGARVGRPRASASARSACA
jgi:iron complex outermembrane receptor protein